MSAQRYLAKRSPVAPCEVAVTKQVKRYLAMYAKLDGITDVEASVAQVDAMQPVWDALSAAEKQQARRARETTGP